MAKNEPSISLIRKFLHILRTDGPLAAYKHAEASLLGYGPDDLTVEYPISIQLSLNKTCNLHCTFCARQTSKIREQLASEKNLVMPIDFLNKNLSIFEKAEYVNIAADGEPLHHPEITKIFQILTSAAQKPNLIFVTNGVLFDEQLAELVVKSQVMEIHFSLDSLTKTTFNFIRPGADLDHLISIIEKINHLKKEYNSEFPRLVLRPTFISKNIEEFPAMVDFCYKYHFSAMLVQQMQIYKKELVKYSLVNCKEDAKRYIEAAILKGKQLGIPIVLDTVITTLEDQGAESINNSLSKIDESVIKTRDMRVSNLREKCSLPWEYMLIQTNGNVQPCCHSNYILGNLNDDPWEKIWNGPRAKKMRQKFMRDTLPKECVNQPCGIGKME